MPTIAANDDFGGHDARSPDAVRSRASSRAMAPHLAVMVARGRINTARRTDRASEQCAASNGRAVFFKVSNIDQQDR
jgi:hypothetical protein